MSNQFCVNGGDSLYINVSKLNGLSLQSFDFANFTLEATNTLLDPVNPVGTPNALFWCPGFADGFEVADNPTAVWDALTFEESTQLDVSGYAYVRLTATAAGCFNVLGSCEIPAAAIQGPPEIDTEHFLVEDEGTNNFYYAVSQHDDTGAFIGINYIPLGSATGTPASPVPVNNEDYETLVECKIAVAAGTGYAIGDKMNLVTLVGTSPVTVIGSVYINEGVEVTPAAGDLIDCGQELVDADILIDCDNNTQTESVNSRVSVVGSENPINVRIVEDCATSIVKDYEYVCNKDTGFYDLHVFTTTDGVENTTPLIVVTTINCDDDLTQYDEEVYCNATTKTQFIRTVSFDEDGTKTVISDVDSGVVCVPAKIDVEIDFVCNTATNLYDRIENIYSDGVLSTEVTTATTIACDEDKPDFEQVRVCRAGTVFIVTNQIDSDGTITEISAVDTLESCTTQTRQTIDDCALVTSATTVDTVVSIAGSEKVLPVRIIEDCEPEVVTDVEFVCNEDTNLFDRVVTVVTDGVVTSETVTATTVACDEDTDTEIYTYCDLTTGTLHEVVVSFDDNDVRTVVSTTDLLIDCTPTRVSKDFELICNADTNVYDLYEWTITDGVAGVPVITPTTVACDEPKPDFELRRRCDLTTGTVKEQLVSVAEDGTEANVGTEVDTLINCVDDPQIEIVRECRAGFVNIVSYQVATDGTLTELSTLVTAEECDLDIVTVDVEYICNEDSNLYDRITTTVTNGVVAPSVVTPTTIACDENPDIEQRSYCDLTTGTLHNVVSSFDENGVETVISTTDLLIDCTPTRIEKDFELVCNETTNVIDIHEWTVTDGVAGVPTITATTIACDATPPSIELRETCDVTTSTIHQQIVQIDENGVETNVGAAIDTLIECNKDQSGYYVENHLCDDDGAGTVTKFFQVKKLDPDTGTFALVGTYLAEGVNAGDAYVPSGTVGECLTKCNPVQVFQECRGGFVTLVSYAVDSDGTLAELNTLTTTEVCGEDDIDVEVDYVCNEDTNVYDKIVTTITNGVITSEVVTATTIACDENPDIEQRSYCDLTTGTIHNVVSSFDAAGVETVISTTNLGIPCTASTVRKDFELICNATTNVYDLYEWTVTDGVAAAPVITATTIACDEGKPDFEIRKTCNALTSTIHEQLVQIDAAGVETNIGASVDTLIACNEQALPGASDIPNSSTGFTITPTVVRSFTVTNEGTDDVVVNIGGGSVTLHRAGSRTWGFDEGTLDISTLSIDTGANSNADITWIV